MPYIYQAECYCDTCGDQIKIELQDTVAPEDRDDSDSWPQWYSSQDESDCPDHCASRSECLDALNLREYGKVPEKALEGAETARIGALITEQLTEHGVEYLKEMLAERPRTPYQKALHRFWRLAFSDYLA